MMIIKLIKNNWLSYMIVVLFATFMFLGAIKIGISTDEGTEILRAQSHLNYIFNTNQLSKSQAAELENLKVREPPGVYGSINYLIAHVVQNIYQTNFTNLKIDNSAFGFQFRHIYIAFLNIYLLVIFLFTLKAYKFQKNNIIIFTLCYFSFPIWIGNSFFNPKDIPVAVGYTLINLALSSINLSSQKIFKYVALINIFFGSLICIGTRSVMVLPILLSFLIITIFYYQEFKKNLIQIFFIFLSSLTVIDYINPNLNFLIYNDLIKIFFETNNYPFTSKNLIGGLVVSEKPPIWYLPFWFIATTPELVFIFLIAFFIGLLNKKFTEYRLLINLLFVQAIFLPLVSIIFNSTKYDAIRHFLFIYPSVIFFAFLGFRYFIEKLKSKQIILGLLVSAILFCSSILYPTIKIFPYNYSYFNLITTLHGVNNKWEVDYWLTSLREASLKIEKDAKILNWFEYWWRPYSEVNEKANEYFNYALWPAKYANNYNSTLNRDYYIIPDECAVIDSINRNLYNKEIKLAFILQCGNVYHDVKNKGIKISSKTPIEIGSSKTNFIWVDEKIKVSLVNEAVYLKKINLIFYLDENPCKIPYEYNINGLENNFVKPLNDSRFEVRGTILLKPMEPKDIEIKIVSQKDCKIKFDNRNLNAKLSFQN